MGKGKINPFAPELPVTAHADPRPFYCLWCHQHNFVCAEWRDLSNDTGMSTIQSTTSERKAKNHVTLTWKFPWKSCSTTHLPFLSSNPKILKAFLKPFPTKMKPTKCPAREKKRRQEKQIKRPKERTQKSKSQDCCVTLKPKNYLEILLSVHARTSQANI